MSDEQNPSARTIVISAAVGAVVGIVVAVVLIALLGDKHHPAWVGAIIGGFWVGLCLGGFYGLAMSRRRPG